MFRIQVGRYGSYLRFLRYRYLAFFKYPTVKINKNLQTGNFLYLNFSCRIRIRTSNTDPDPGGRLNMDAPGSGPETLTYFILIQSK